MKKSTLIHGLVAALAVLPALAPAANLTFDANTAVGGAQDGAGTWDNATANWWTGAANAAFSSVTPDAPTIGALNGAAGTVTLGANIVAGNLTFNVPGVGNYTVAGGGFTLSLTNRTITANINGTISANIGGGSLTTANSGAPNGTLILSGSNAYTGGLVLGVNAASTTTSARLAHSNAAGTGTIGFNSQGNSTSPRLELIGGITVTNPISITGRNVFATGVESISGANVLSGAITPGAGGVVYMFGVDGGSLTLSGTTTVQANGGRNVVLRGSGNGTVSGIIAGGTVASPTNAVEKVGSGTWTLSGANTYAGAVEVAGGTLALDYSSQNNSKLPDANVLYLVGGALNLTGGSHTEVVGSSTVGAGPNSVTRSSGTGILRLNAITRLAGGALDFGAASIADTDSSDVNGILGGYATVAGADWAHSGAAAADTAVTAYTGYTDIAASGSTIADSAATNVRLNSAGGGGNISLAAATTTVNTLLQNTTTAATVDTAAGTLRLGASGGVLVPNSKQSLTIGTTANSGTLTAGGAANTAGEIILINNSSSALTVNSIITNNGSGTVSLTKSGSGDATLNGYNTHTGTNYIVGGNLNVGSISNLGTGSIVINGGTLNLTASVDLSGRVISLGAQVGLGNGTIGVASSQFATNNSVIQNNISGLVNPSVGAANSGILGMATAGTLTKTGNGTLVLGGVNTYTLGTIINGGTVSITASTGIGAQPSCYIPDHLVVNGGTLEAAATLTLGNQRGILLGAAGGSGTGTFQADSSVTLQLDSRIADNWNGNGAFIVAGPGTVIVTGGANDYSGNTTISSGTLQVNHPRAIPNGAGKGNVVVNGTLAINGTNVAINGFSGSGGTVDNITGNSVTFSVGNNNQGGTFSGTIQNSGGGALTLDKAGSATVTLSSVTATHTGSTTVSGGTLTLTGSTAIGSTTNIAVGSGTTLDVSGLSSTLTLNSGQTLSGKGTVVGPVDTGTGALAPGASAGTLTNSGSLTLGSGSSLNYELANVTTIGGGVNDFTVVTGNLTVAGPVTLNVTFLNAIPASSGKYTLISYGGTFSGNVTDISVPSGFTISNNATAKTVELLINHVSASLVWRGDGSANVWDINTTANWGSVGSPLFFFNGDTAIFDNTGSNTPAINVASPGVVASEVIVSTTQNYDFTGSPVAANTFSKNGSSTLILETDLQFLGGGIISNGTVQVGNGATSGTIGGGNLTNNGALTFNRTDGITVTNPISGTGTLAQNGTGDVGLNASNSYTGGTTVSAGRVFVMNGNSLGATNSGTTVASGSQVYITQNVNVGNESLTLNGTGPSSDGTGALRKGGAGATTWGGALTLTDNTIINVDGGATLTLTNANGITSSGQNLTLTGGGAGIVNGPIALGTGGGVLSMTGTGSWTLGGSNSMSLATIPSGNIILAHSNALGTNLAVVLTSTTGGPGLSGTRLTLSGGIGIPGNRSLTMPSAGAGSTRSAFFGTGTGVTNIWAGSIGLFGDGNVGNFIALGVDNGSTLIISGNVTNDSTFPGKLLLRGNGAGSGVTGTGIVTGTITLDGVNGQVQVDDGTTWVLAGSPNTWVSITFAGASTIRLGVNNAMPTNAVLVLGNNNANRLDLAGFNQQVAGMGLAGLNITNSSTSADSTLTYAAAGQTTFGGTISDSTKQLNLTVATGNLTLTNPPTLNLTKSTVSVAGGGAALELDYIGTNTIAALVLNGVGQSPGLYNSGNVPLYLNGTGNLLVGTPIANYSTNITATVSGSTLALSWPATHLGWILQAQTNSLAAGLNTGWTDVSGTASVTSTNIAINPANPTVFFRLRHP